MNDSVPNGMRIDVNTMYGAATRQPLVEFIIGPADGSGNGATRVCLTPEKARELGAMLIAVAHGSEADAFLVAFLATKINVPAQAVFPILHEFREWRDARVSTTRLSTEGETK